MSYENWKILKTELAEKQEEYTKVAEWCTENNQYYIKDNGEYYLVEKIPDPTEDEMKERVRYIRNQYLSDTDVKMIVDYPISDEDRESYKQYRTYLRNYTDTENWWLENPKSYNEWKEIN